MGSITHVNNDLHTSAVTNFSK